MAGCRTLDTGRKDVPSTPLTLVLGFFLDRPHHLGHVVAHFIFGALQNDLARTVPS